MEYFGKERSWNECEILALQLDPTVRDGEADLMRSRWFDYLDLHPSHATYLFAHHYSEQTRAFYIETIDVRSAEEVRGFAPADIFKSRDLTGMWRARQAADALGVPYPFALRFAHDRALNRLYRTFPRPNQLYGEEFELDLRDAWQELCTRSLQFSRMPEFAMRNYTGNADQMRHVQFVIEQILRRPRPHAGLLTRAFNEDILSPRMALVVETFDRDDIHRAAAVAA